MYLDTYRVEPKTVTSYFPSISGKKLIYNEINTVTTKINIVEKIVNKKVFFLLVLINVLINPAKKPYAIETTKKP
jgi:hypothetical protein